MISTGAGGTLMINCFDQRQKPFVSPQAERIPFCLLYLTSIVQGLVALAQDTHVFKCIYISLYSLSNAWGNSLEVRAHIAWGLGPLKWIKNCLAEGGKLE